jgi:GNAT superfamily N-acetyltransferase
LTPKITLQIRPFDSNDIEEVKKINRPSEARLCAQRLSYGHRGVVASHKGQIAGYAWGAPQIVHSLERIPLDLVSGDVLCVDAYTAPSYRGLGIQTALTLARFRLFRDLGYQRALAYIETDNQPSLTVWRKFDSDVVNIVDFLRIGPWRRVRIQ